MKRSVRVVVAGTELAIRTDARERYVEELAAFVTGKVEEVRQGGRPASTQSAALLAAMNIAHELFGARDRDSAFRKQVVNRSKKILRYLEREQGERT